MGVSSWLAGHKDQIEAVSNIAVIFAAMAGGVWALFRLRRERTDEAAVNLTVSTYAHRLGQKDDYVVAIAVEIANKGKTKVQAKTEKKHGYSFDDGVEKLYHPCSLQIKRFSITKPAPPHHVDWFEPSIAEAVPELIPEINLLTEYEDPENHNIVDFWLEPGEVYNLEMPVVLPSGIYLGKVTFVAAGGDCNFWSRVFTFAVPGNPGNISAGIESE